MPLSFNFGKENDPEVLSKRPRTPVTLLAGFLGAGKTTLLKHLLENQRGLRVGVVVNDLASVNIDSQLLRRYDDGDMQLVELQNGCVCCSSADDLFAAVQGMVMRSKDEPFEQILVELSGVGDPEAIRRNWVLATECQLPAALRTRLAKVLTLVDASTFARDWQDTREALQRNSGPEIHEEKQSSRDMVGQLLAHQIELADALIVNKCDLASREELGEALSLLEALNKTAEVHQTEFGCVPLDVLPPVPYGLKVQHEGQEDGYSWTQTANEVWIRMPIQEHVRGKDVDFSLKKRSLRLGLRGRSVASGQLAGDVAHGCDAMFEIERSSLGARHVVLCLEKQHVGMWSELWKSSPPLCGHQGCNGHCLHQKRRAFSDKVQHFGSFVFQRRRPFNSGRLVMLLESWQEALKVKGGQGKAKGLAAVMRSKGFAWCDAAPLHRHRWAQAGRCISCSKEAHWWHVLTEEQRRFRLGEPGAEAEFQALQPKWHRLWGDRRQELVFIGARDMDEQDIVSSLEQCLLTDEEFERFKETTSGLRVSEDEIGVKDLLRRMGAGGMPDGQETKDEDTDFLRSLGVGSSLEECPFYEAVD